MNGFLTYESWDEGKVLELNTQLKESMDVLKWAFQEYGSQITYACSFGAEGVVLIDLISKIMPNATVIFLDTELHFLETYKLIAKMEEKYPRLVIEKVKSSLTLNGQAELYGDEIWKTEPDQCCHMRKIIPLSEQLQDKAAWISGLRREQSETRKKVDFINRDEKFKKIKVCPLIHWTWEDIWSYIKLHELPYNELHDRSYPSIGCKTCTLPATDPNDHRSGRWAMTDKKECGLHRELLQKQGGISND
ncbi:phosphoadenylyl-sulfate reductase [Mesobacillus zeae]|uniref:Adenosine 5'-phosphosulfate reductase n=1 Tax=Mesobacillus zeae TaxID=1917180 RepID=A0A398BN79_9BACI|nr:phosphoadenylyl-sulfate reductase [Mesobacillus zeae]RID88813.1 phosphoadenylyl-sulfate reductase [Mesobacillus zeae]